MSDGNNLAHQAALSLISADARFFLDLALSPGLEAVRPIAALALLPFLSAFVYESARFVQDPSATRKLEIHEEMLVTSRMRLKLIEDKYRSSAEVLDSAHELASVVSRWFLEDHPGTSRSAEEPPQPDMGIFFIQNEIICTTHVAFLNMGLSKKSLVEQSLSLDSLGTYLHDRMIDIGEYIALLSDILSIDADATVGANKPGVPAMGFRDVQSKEFYKSLDSRIRGNLSISILLTSVLSLTNTSRLLVPLIDRTNEIAVWKMKFLSAFQAASTFQKLLEENHHQSLLHSDGVEWLHGILNDDSVRKLGAYRGLRNILVHYRLDKRTAAGLTSELPLSGLVEAATDGNSLEAVQEEVEQGLQQVSEGILKLIPGELTPEGVL